MSGLSSSGVVWPMTGTTCGPGGSSFVYLYLPLFLLSPFWFCWASSRDALRSVWQGPAPSVLQMFPLGASVHLSQTTLHCLAAPVGEKTQPGNSPLNLPCPRRDLRITTEPELKAGPFPLPSQPLLVNGLPSA